MEYQFIQTLIKQCKNCGLLRFSSISQKRFVCYKCEIRKKIPFWCWVLNKHHNMNHNINRHICFYIYRFHIPT